MLEVGGFNFQQTTFFDLIVKPEIPISAYSLSYRVTYHVMSTVMSISCTTGVMKVTPIFIRC